MSDPDRHAAAPEAAPVPSAGDVPTNLARPPGEEDAYGVRVVAGRYRLESRIGRGAAGEVYSAEDLLTGQRVALKILFGPVEERMARARRELAALRLLRLPGVVRLLDEGVDLQRQFLVMELIDGLPFPGSLGKRAWETIANTVLALLEALARVHDAGVVHRDLKPANVLVDANGRPTILDFGLARGAAVGTTLTEQGALLGTPAYLAPEQVQGDTVDARADLYAIGVMLYEALTGQPPYTADAFHRLLYAKLTRRPTPVQQLAPEVPARVAETIDRLLERHPGDRPRSAAEAMALLRGETAPPGERRELPWLGHRAPVEALLAAARAGRPMDVAGSPGSGRTRCLREMMALVAAEGRRVVWLARATQPFESLALVIGPLDELDSQSLEEATGIVDRALRTALAGTAGGTGRTAGVVIVADEAERLDRWSAAALERCRGAGAVHRAVAAPAPDAVALAPLPEEALRPLFAGPERLLHLPEDAAHELWHRTAGVPAAMADEVRAWERSGLARWESGRLALGREAVDRLRAGRRAGGPALRARGSVGEMEPPLEEMLAWIALAWPHTQPSLLRAVARVPPWVLEAEVQELVRQGAARVLADGRAEPLAAAMALQHWPAERRTAAHRGIAELLPLGEDGRFFHVVAAHLDAEVGREACALAERLAREGDLGEATAVLEEALHVVRQAGGEEEVALLEAHAKVALAVESPRALDRTLYEIGRARARGERLIVLEHLLRAAVLVSQGDGERALADLEALPAPADPELAYRVQATRAGAAGRCTISRHEQVMESIESWAGAMPEPEMGAHLAGWLGLLRYRQGQFAEAAELQARAATGKGAVPSRLSAMLNASSALLEVGHFDAAGKRAEMARALAADCRHTHYEARAAWIVRSAAYRAGKATVPDREVLDAAAHLELPYMEGLLCLNEAAVSWRAGETAYARELARRSAIKSRAGGIASAAILADCLAIACGEPSNRESLLAVADEAARCAIPGITVQALALLTLAPGAPRATLREDAELVAEAIPAGDRDRRREVLSIREALSMAANPHSGGTE